MRIGPVIVIALALSIAIVPQFTDCLSQGRQLTLANGSNVPMKCHWTAVAELGMSLPLFATGLVLAASRRKEGARTLGLVTAALGVAVLLLPVTLIGVCSNPDMICHSVMRPFLVLAGTLTLLYGLGTMAVSAPSKGEAERVGLA
ncbi:MAG: DUF4418 family protein [Sphingomonadaceae bacterium]